MKHRGRALRRRYGHASRLSPKARMALAEALSSGTVRAGHVHTLRTLESLEKRGLLRRVYEGTFQPTTSAALSYASR